jgi:hypothetical protein
MELITTCVIVHSPGTSADEHGRVCVGHCPACHQAVMHDGSKPNEAPTPGDGPVWTCPTDLQEGNPHHAESEVSEALQEARGIYSNCADDFPEMGIYCPHDVMPLHSACYQSNKITY